MSVIIPPLQYTPLDVIVWQLIVLSHVYTVMIPKRINTVQPHRVVV